MPLIILFCGAFVTFILTRLVPSHKSLIGSALSSLSILLSLYCLIQIAGQSTPAVYPSSPANFVASLRFDALSILLSGTALVLGLLVSIFSYKYMEGDESQDKYYALLLILLGAIVGLSSAADLFNLWVFFELMCVSSYILVAFRNERWESVEAGFKYLVMSVSGSMLVLLGISVIFGQLGQLDLLKIHAQVSGMQIPLVGAAVLFIAGFGVKAAIVPFHTWLPDAHSEAPSGISAMLSGIVIEAGLFAMLRSVLSLTGLGIGIGTIFIVAAVFSMFVGNIMALAQKRLKRMLAYSSIAQMGYIVLGLGIGLQFKEISGLEGGFFHIITHAGMKGLTFLAAGLIIHSIGSGDIDDMSGLAKKMPLLALSFAIAVLGLAGVPPMSGFMSKWLIYKSGIMAGGIGYLLSGIAIFNSVLSLGYYLPVMNVFYSPNVSVKVKNSHSLNIFVLAPVIVLAMITVFLGIYPELGLRLAGPCADQVMMMIRGAR